MFNISFNQLILCVWQETDYVMSYFDNEEEFGGESDDNLDEAIYWIWWLHSTLLWAVTVSGPVVGWIIMFGS